MKELSIIIVNYRTPDFVIDTLKSLQDQIRVLDASVIIVDNNSQDGSVKRIQHWIDDCNTSHQMKLIESNENAGFAAGNNIGIKALKANYYLLLNSDTIVRKNAISELLFKIQENSKIGLVGPRLEWPDGKGQESAFKFHRPISEFLAAADTGIIDKLFIKYIVAIPLDAKNQTIEWISFACVLIRDEVFKDIGLLDEDFFMYFEDSEFCLRAVKSNWFIAYHPEAHVVHLRGGSSPVKKNALARKRLPRYYYESRTRYFYLRGGALGLFAANILWNLGRSISFIRQVLGRPDKRTIDKQWSDIWINFLHPLNQYTHPKNKEAR